MKLNLLKICLTSILVVGLTSDIYAETKLRDGTVLSDKPQFIVTYIEVAPGTEDKAAALIKKQTATGKSQAGNLRMESLQRIGRKNHFVLLEAWTDPAARNNHAILIL